MTTLSTSPRTLRAGLLLLDPNTGGVRRIITLQYNPDTLTRTLQVQGTSAEGGSRTEALRLRAPAVETIKLDAEIDATDQLENPDRNPNTVSFGIQPQLAALASLVNPPSSDLVANSILASSGAIEILPAQAPLTLFIWSTQRILPVRVTELTITEEAFDPSLNPIRAKVSLGLRVLTVDDVGFDHRAGQLFLGHLQAQERLVTKAPSGTVADFGLANLP